MTRKRPQLLKRAAPSVSRVALISTTPGRGGHETQLADAERAAGDLGFSVKAYRASSLSELTAALEAVRGDQMNGLLNFQGGLSLANRQLIVDFAATHIPVQHPEPYQLHLNKKAATAIGLTLPAALVAEANKVLS